MEARNVQTASTYLNNVLLARGLLKGGRPINFAQPEDDEGGSEMTIARIINLVNELVIRRDVCGIQVVISLFFFFFFMILTGSTARS